jgi:hypothetical protein
MVKRLFPSFVAAQPFSRVKSVYGIGTNRPQLSRFNRFLAGNLLGMTRALIRQMPRTIVHVERKSRFLRALLPTYPCLQEIRFGLIDYLSIGFAFACFVGMVCVLAG